MPTPRGNAGVAIGITFTTISLGILFARLYTRFVLVKNSGVEEIAIIFAWLFCLAHCILVIVEIENGLGGHLVDFDLQQQEKILLPFYASVPMYTISLALSKAAILLLYMRLFPGHRFAIYCWITMVALAVFMLWGCFGFMFMCQPIALLWDKSLTGTCIDGRIPYFSASAFNILTDFVVFGLPLPILSKLQVPKKQKILLIILFGLGLIGCLTSVLRLKALYALSVSTDYVYDVLEAAIWSLAETNVGFICACVPTLKPLISALLPHLMSEKHVREISPTVGHAASSSPRNSHARQLQTPDNGIGIGVGIQMSGTTMTLSEASTTTATTNGKKPPHQHMHKPFAPSHKAYAQFDVERQAGGMRDPDRRRQQQQGITVTTSVVQDVVDTDHDVFGDATGEESDNASTRGLRMK